MDSTETSANHRAIDDLLELIAERVPAERRDAIEAFAKAYTRRLTEEEFGETDVTALCGMVLSTFAFADDRGLLPTAVRVFVPDPAVDGYEAPGSVIETSTDDSPFLVDSVREELAARDLMLRRVLHPVVGTVRDEQGRIERVMSGRDASHRESVMHFEIDRRLSDEESAELEKRVRSILARRAAGRARLRADAAAREAHDRDGAGRRGALLPAGGGRDGRLPRLAPAAELRAARLPRVRAASTTT